MLKTIFFFFFIFYVLIFIQTGFLVHFGINGIFFNLVLILVILINLFNFSHQEKIVSAVVGGIFLDIFSLSDPIGFFGLHLLTLLAFSFLLKIILEKYVRIPFFGKQ